MPASIRLAPALVCFVLVSAIGRPVTAEDKKTEPPTSAIVKKVLEASYRAEWGKDWGNAKAEKLSVDVTEPKIGEVIMRQLRRGQLAQPVHPAKAVVTIVVKYVGNDKPKTQVLGAGDGDVFLMYKDAFGEWTFKTGSL
jgi:hypothetical protein